MTTFAVHADGRLSRAAVQMDDDLPIHVDDRTNVSLSQDNEVMIQQDRPSGYHAVIMVTDVNALSRALTQAQLVQAERQAMDDRPMLDDQRKAIFAALREVYGTVSRERRQAIVSAIVQRPIESFSTRYPVTDPLTRAEASHVLDVLNA